MALEDTILFTRVLDRYYDQPLAKTFEVFEKLRKPRIDAAFEEADWRWENTKDVGFVGAYIRDWLATVYLWWMRKAHVDNCAYDVRSIPLEG